MHSKFSYLKSSIYHKLFFFGQFNLKIESSVHEKSLT